MRLQTFLASTVRDWLDLTKKDLAALTDEQLNLSPGGVARPPQAFILEVAYLNHQIAAILSGQVQDENTEETPAAMDRQALTSALAESVERVANAIETMSDEDLEREVTAPWGQPMTGAALAGLAVSHLVYHNGQLNYFQTLHGDSQIHWSD